MSRRERARALVFFPIYCAARKPGRSSAASVRSAEVHQAARAALQTDGAESRRADPSRLAHRPALRQQPPRHLVDLDRAPVRCHLEGCLLVRGSLNPPPSPPPALLLESNGESSTSCVGRARPGLRRSPPWRTSILGWVETPSRRRWRSLSIFLFLFLFLFF